MFGQGFNRARSVLRTSGLIPFASHTSALSASASKLIVAIIGLGLTFGATSARADVDHAPRAPATATPDSAVSPNDEFAGFHQPSDAESLTILHFPKLAPSWGFDVGFFDNGPRTGAELQVNAPFVNSHWVPNLGLGIRSIDIEGHRTGDAAGTEDESAAFVFLAAKFQNPIRTGVVRPYATVKLGVLMTDQVANAKASGAGYVGFGGEFPYTDLVQGLFSNRYFERSLNFFVESGVLVSNAVATRMDGNPYIFNGISMTVGLKWNL